jgi:hypothetical protein
MANPRAAAVMNNLRPLLDNPDLVQRLLDDARADLDRNNALLAEAAHLMESLAYAAALIRSSPLATEEQRTACAPAILATASANYDYFLKKRWLLTQLVASLLFVRAVASARSRAHLLPGLLLTAFSAAVLLYVSTWGGVVPGLRSFVRFSILMLGFLFASDRPLGGGGGG